MPRLYCIPPCTCAHGLPCLRAVVWGCSCPRPAPSSTGRQPLPATPRGGSIGRPGGANKTGAPLHARESKNPSPPSRRTRVAHLVHWQYLLAEWDAEHARKYGTTLHPDALTLSGADVLAAFNDYGAAP